MNQAKATAASNLALLTQQAESLRKKKAEQATLAAALELQIVERRTQLAALERSRDACDSSYRGIVNRIQEARLAAEESVRAAGGAWQEQYVVAAPPGAHRGPHGHDPEAKRPPRRSGQSPERSRGFLSVPKSDSWQTSS
jgi:hypothetical protein